MLLLCAIKSFTTKQMRVMKQELKVGDTFAMVNVKSFEYWRDDHPGPFNRTFLASDGEFDTDSRFLYTIGLKPLGSDSVVVVAVDSPVASSDYHRQGATVGVLRIKSIKPQNQHRGLFLNPDLK